VKPDSAPENCFDAYTELEGDGVKASPSDCVHVVKHYAQKLAFT
jgi:hypothetical protein